MKKFALIAALLGSSIVIAQTGTSTNVPSTMSGTESYPSSGSYDSNNQNIGGEASVTDGNKDIQRMEEAEQRVQDTSPRVQKNKKQR